MVSLEQLWMPIIAAAVAVFVVSSLIHMVFKWHNNEYRKLPNEEEARAALRASAGSPGIYFVPHMSHHKEMNEPAMRQKFVEGPVAMITMRRAGPPGMGGALGQWFVLNLVVAAVAAYLASKAVPPGASFLAVARYVSLVTFFAYAGGALSSGIWMGKPWSAVMKEVLDAFLYGLASACVFAWLWPKG
jgi:hypothetical protein